MARLSSVGTPSAAWMHWAVSVSAGVWVLPAGVSLGSDYRLLSRRPVRERLRYEVISYPEFTVGELLSERARQAALQLGQERGELVDEAQRAQDLHEGLQGRRAVALDPESVTARNNLGVLLAGRGDLEAARHQWEEALRLAPDSTEIRRNLEILEGMAGSN